MSQPSAQIVADSISPDGVRLTSAQLVVHPSAVEHLLRHRAFSFSAGSKRAIPLAKQLAEVEADPCYPAEFTREQKGMQGGPALTGDELEDAQMVWRCARNDALLHAKTLGDLGVHKEVASRPLQPYQWRTYLVTATDWDGFFAQRRREAGAQADIVAVAEAIQSAMAISRPSRLQYGEWHMPYVDEATLLQCGWDIDPRKVSAARIARVSYLTQDGVRDLEEDVRLYERLRSNDPPHWSPMEPVATPAHPASATHGSSVLGNFRGWHQLRHLVLDGDVL